MYDPQYVYLCYDEEHLKFSLSNIHYEKGGILNIFLRNLISKVFFSCYGTLLNFSTFG